MFLHTNEVNVRIYTLAKKGALSQTTCKSAPFIQSDKPYFIATSFTTATTASESLTNSVIGIRSFFV